jgi:hypothetical protein
LPVGLRKIQDKIDLARYKIDYKIDRMMCDMGLVDGTVPLPNGNRTTDQDEHDKRWRECHGQRASQYRGAVPRGHVHGAGRRTAVIKQEVYDAFDGRILEAVERGWIEEQGVDENGLPISGLSAAGRAQLAREDEKAARSAARRRR